MILPEMGSPPGKSLKLSQLCGPGSAICDAGWPTPDCPWSMSVCRSQKKYFRNFNFNFNYRELLSKSATFSLCGFGVVGAQGVNIVICPFSSHDKTVVHKSISKKHTNRYLRPTEPLGLRDGWRAAKYERTRYFPLDRSICNFFTRGLLRTYLRMIDRLAKLG